MASMTRTIARGIARTNMKRAGMEKINKKHRYDKTLHVAGESIFSRNWRRFCTAKVTAYTLEQERKQQRRGLRKKTA